MLHDQARAGGQDLAGQKQALHRELYRFAAPGRNWGKTEDCAAHFRILLGCLLSEALLLSMARFLAGPPVSAKDSARLSTAARICFIRHGLMSARTDTMTSG